MTPAGEDWGIELHDVYRAGEKFLAGIYSGVWKENYFANVLVECNNTCKMSRGVLLRL